MATPTEAIRDRTHAEVGEILARDAEAIIEAWSDRAIAERHGRPGAHRSELRDHLPEFLRVLGEELADLSTDEADTPRHRAVQHGRFRWQVGWELEDVVVDYQLLQVVTLGHLRTVLGREPILDEVIAIGVHFDDAVAEAVVAFVEHQADQLQQAHRRLNEFLGVLGHELRNPLGTIAVALQLARVGGPVEGDVGEAIDVIGRSVGTMARLMDDMLDVARVTRGDLEVRPRPVDLGAILSAAVNSCRPLVAARNHRLTVSGPPEGLSLQADPTRLEQVVINLITNAAKYTEPGGSIEVEVGGEGDGAVIRVRDSGVGIAPEFLPHVFDLFAQAPEHSGRGLGIGLALVRSLVERHGGTISAQSDGPGRGSTFTLRLPLAEAPAPPAQAGPAGIGPGAAARPRRILVVDDERDAARLLAALLEQAGHEVRVAFDGSSALAEAAAAVPEIVLLDLGLPDLDGAEVARRLRTAGTPGTLIVALTGFSPGQLPGEDPSGDDPSFDLFLTKPVEADALARIFDLGDRPAAP